MSQHENGPVEVEECSGCGKTAYLRARDGDLLCPVCYAYMDYHDAISAELIIMLEEWGKKRREGLYKERLWDAVHDIIFVTMTTRKNSKRDSKEKTMPLVKVFTGEDRHKPRYHRYYRLTVHDVPTWAVQALVEFLTKEGERFDYDLELPTAEVTVQLRHTSVIEDDSEAFTPFWERINALWLGASMELIETRKGRSVAEVEEEDAKKR